MNRLKSLRTRLKQGEGNKGFTLVELIVVIVILAILIGVTIGGIYKYVGQSRTNTDENNKSSLQSVLSTVCAEEEVYTWANTSPEATVTITIAKGGNTKDEIKTAIGDKFGTGSKIPDLICELIPDGVGSSKTGQSFQIILKKNYSDTDKKGNPTLEVKLVAGADAISVS